MPPNSQPSSATSQQLTANSPNYLILLLLLCPLLLSGSLTAPFLDFDDAEHVNAAVVTGEAPWQTVFSQTSGSIFPLTLLSFRAERVIFPNTLGVKNWAPLCRIDNLILHAIAGVCVWHIFRALAFSLGWRVLLTGAFLFHPMACESVCWVSERKNVLAAAFGFGALAVSLNYRGRFRALLVFLLYLIALFSKPSALGLLPALLVLQFPGIVRRITATPDAIPQPPSEARPAIVLCLLLAAVAVFSAALNLRSHSLMIVKPPGGSVFTALLTDAEIFRRYFQNLLCPIGLSAAYAVKPIVSPADPRFLMNFAIVFSFVAATVWLSRRRALSLFLWWWFFAGLGPVMNLVATELLMQDRYVYLSCPAFFGAVALALDGAALRLGYSRLNEKAASLAIAAVLMTLLFGAIARSLVWESVFPLYADAVEKQPESAFARLNFARALRWSAERTIAIGGDNERAENWRHEAVQQIEVACKLDDFERFVNPGTPYDFLAILQLERGRLDDSEAASRRLLQDNFHTPVSFPTKINAYVRLAYIDMQRTHYSDALQEAQEAIRIAERNTYPAPDAWLQAGEALEKLGRRDEAIEAYDKIQPGCAEYEHAKEQLAKLH